MQHVDISAVGNVHCKLTLTMQQRDCNIVNTMLRQILIVEEIRNVKRVREALLNQLQRQMLPIYSIYFRSSPSPMPLRVSWRRSESERTPIFNAGMACYRTDVASRRWSLWAATGRDATLVTVLRTPRHRPTD